MIDLQNTEFKSLEELKEICPTIFTKKGSSETSEKYTHIPTENVIRDMETLGWFVVDAKQVNTRAAAKQGFQKHLVVFRNPDLKIERNGDTAFPQVLMTNSHNGKSSFQFETGIYRMICENGLVVATDQFDKHTIRHMGYDYDTLKDTIKMIVEKLPLTVESMNKMINTELQENQILELAEKMLNARIEGTNNTIDFTSVDEVNFSQRKEDTGGDLWSSFNRIQENIIEGNFKYKTAKGKLRFARPVKNFQQDVELNKKMFNLALEYAI
jgi:hypothetical protein